MHRRSVLLGIDKHHCGFSNSHSLHHPRRITGSVTEDGTSNLVHTFTRSGAITRALTFNSTVGGTAWLVAAGKDPADYTFLGSSSTATSRAVTFAAGSSNASVTVDPIDYTAIGANETVALTLAARSGYTIGTTSAVSGTITNDDVKSSVSFSLGPDHSSLRLTGTRRINDTGNILVNTVICNSAKNMIACLGGKDILTGGGGTADRDVFMFFQLSDSLLLDPFSGKSQYFDQVTDFNSNDRITVPFSVETNLLTAAVGTAASIAQGANAVAAFTASSHSGFFIALNDNRDGLQADTDSILWLRNYSIGATNVVELV